MVVVQEAGALADPWRRRYYTRAIARLRPHVTALYPFVPAARVDSALLDELSSF